MSIGDKVGTKGTVVSEKIGKDEYKTHDQWVHQDWENWTGRGNRSPNKQTKSCCKLQSDLFCGQNPWRSAGRKTLYSPKTIEEGGKDLHTMN